MSVFILFRLIETSTLLWIMNLVSGPLCNLVGYREKTGLS